MENVNKESRKKTYIISFLCLVIISGIIIYGTNKSNSRFSIEDKKIRYIEEQIDGKEKIIFKDKGKNLLTVTIDKKGNPYFSFAEQYTVYYLDKIIVVDTSDVYGARRKIRLSDGTPYEEDIVNSIVRGYIDGKPKPFDVQLVHGIEDVIKFRKDMISPIFIIIFPSILIALGLVGIIYPEKLWKLDHFLTVEGGEPTEFAIMMNFLGGIFVVLYGLLSYPIHIGW